MTPCVCTHPVYAHFACEGMCFEFECGCSIYHPDDGSELGTLSGRCEPYEGIYRGPYKLGESA